ncbi:MAG: DNA-3-methyladenine glycosylase family protein [Candidatus Hodarchaeota archaeon]
MEELILPDKTPFNLKETVLCGQTFRWRKINNFLYGVVNKTIIKIAQQKEKNRLTFEYYPENYMGRKEIEHYFALDHDLLKILSQINKDKLIEEAINKYHGLRILRQQPWECLISFILATNKGIPQIKRMIENLCRKFGEKIVYEGRTFYSFPDSEVIKNASMTEILECGVGYRAQSILDTACKVAEGIFDLEELKKHTYETLKGHLMKARGVGQKAADCVALFAYEKLSAFPIDVNIRCLMLEHYGNLFKDVEISLNKNMTKKQYEFINNRGRKYFGEYAGYAQEYLYHYYRQQKKKKNRHKA